MATHDYLYWYKNVLRKQLKLALRIYLSIAIVLSPIFLMNSANAASLGGWTLGGGIAQGASTVYEGTKKVVIDGVDYIKKGTASIRPTSTQVAKTLAKGAAGYALSFAVQELLGAVDWVLDPANNQIKYWDEPGNPYYLGEIGSNPFGEGKTREEACQNYATSYQNKFGTASTVYYYSTVGIQGTPTPTSTYWCYLNKMVYSTVYPNSVRVDGKINVEELGQTEGEVKTYPLPAIADFLINKAEEGNTTAQGATLAAAADIVAEAETDDAKARPIVQQLEASAQTKPADQAAAEKANEAQGQTKPNEANPEATDISLQFPVFCNWAPTICEAAQVVISFPNTLTGWYNDTKTKTEEWATSISEAWTAAKDWATTEPQEKEPENLDIEDLNIEAEQVNLSGSNICPQDSVSFSVMGNSVTLDMPYQPVCDALNFFKPAVLLVGAVASVYIVAGVRTKEEDQP